MASKRYDHQDIEQTAQKRWQDLDLYTTNLTKQDPYYLLTEFPYPSGDLHTGHWYAFSLPDIYARYLRMTGKNVLFPIGFDAFGLPAENAAIKHGKDPAAWTEANMARMREQLKSMGASFDWSKEVATCSPDYYRWTQWLFLKLFEHNLAYRANASVKWCPQDRTVLANEQVIDGHCERCDTPVEEKKLTQWFLKITDYAERLLTDLDPLPWREDLKEAQRAWIGKSEGAEIPFKLSSGETVSVFTTRPETVYGATYLVLAPEHELVSLLRATNQKEVDAYVEQTKRKTERERSENKEKTGVHLEGVTATNPATNEEIPVYLADYVLASYGTGAVMAVPAHDERDFEFSLKHKLPVREVVIPRTPDVDNPPQEGKKDTFRKTVLAIVRDPRNNQYLVLRWKQQPWSTFITGGIEEREDPVEAARREVEEETGYHDLTIIRVLGGQTQAEFFAAHKDVNRKIHATSVLFELASDAQKNVSAEEQAAYDIAWLSEEDVEQEGLRHGEFNLIWRRVKSGVDAYTGPGVLTNSEQFTERDSEEAKWDITEHVGGVRTTRYRLRDWLVSRQRYWGCPIPIVYDPEGKAHAVPPEHLPWTLPTDVDFTPTDAAAPLASSKELTKRVESIFGKGWKPERDTLDTFVDSSWYFTRYLEPNNDERFSDAQTMKTWLPVNRYSGGSEHTTMHLLYARFFYKALFDLALVPTSEPFEERFNRGVILGLDGTKMSKSKGNVVNPDEYVARYGADAVRMYLAFIGPYNEPGHYPWKPEGVLSMRKFLDRLYALREDVTDTHASESADRSLAKANKKIAEDITRFKLNTAVSALMVLVNELEHEEKLSRKHFMNLLELLAPFAPHLAEHLYQEAKGEKQSIHQESWPTFDESLLEEEVVTIAVQIAGKRRAEITLAPDASEEDAVAAALKEEKIAEALTGGSPSRVIYVQGRILNLIP